MNGRQTHPSIHKTGLCESEETKGDAGVILVVCEISSMVAGCSDVRFASEGTVDWLRKLCKPSIDLAYDMRLDIQLFLQWDWSYWRASRGSG